MNDWVSSALGALASFQKGRKVEVSKYPRAGYAPYLGASVLDGGPITEFAKTSGAVIATEGDVLMLWDGERSGLVGRRKSGVVSSTVAKLSPRLLIDADLLYYLLNYHFEWIQGHRTGTGVPHVPKDLSRILVLQFPKDQKKQRRIAEILSTVDEAIEQTEALIAKTQKIKAGLMHDLFTRGVLPNGKLRPPREEARQLYKQSPLGWIPKEWEVQQLVDTLLSISDGPFGSNLKTEHYVPEPGVRVVRLQNIGEGLYDDSVRAYVDESHARLLIRHQVLPGDILVAGLGEDRNPTGRACCYPEGLDPAINKADCFRLRSKPDVASNSFVMNYLNSKHARWQVRRLEQGVTRRRCNASALGEIKLLLPGIAEQKRIVEAINCITHTTDSTNRFQEQLLSIKHGLMHDLLTGKVGVSKDDRRGKSL